MEKLISKPVADKILDLARKGLTQTLEEIVGLITEPAPARPFERGDRVKYLDSTYHQGEEADIIRADAYGTDIRFDDGRGMGVDLKSIQLITPAAKREIRAGDTAECKESGEEFVVTSIDNKRDILYKEHGWYYCRQDCIFRSRPYKPEPARPAPKYKKGQYIMGKFVSGIIIAIDWSDSRGDWKYHYGTGTSEWLWESQVTRTEPERPAPKFEIGQTVVHATNPVLSGKIHDRQWDSYHKRWEYMTVPNTACVSLEDFLSLAPEPDWKVGDKFVIGGYLLTVDEIRAGGVNTIQGFYPWGNLKNYARRIVSIQFADEKEIRPGMYVQTPHWIGLTAYKCPDGKWRVYQPIHGGHDGYYDAADLRPATRLEVTE